MSKIVWEATQTYERRVCVVVCVGVRVCVRWYLNRQNEGRNLFSFFFFNFHSHPYSEEKPFGDVLTSRVTAGWFTVVNAALKKQLKYEWNKDEFPWLCLWTEHKWVLFDEMIWCDDLMLWLNFCRFFFFFFKGAGKLRRGMVSDTLIFFHFPFFDR